MLSVCLIFLYVLMTAYLTGFLVLILIGRILIGKKNTGLQKYLPQAENTNNCIMAGFVVLTVYAQTFSIFYKVGFAANILLILICIFSAIAFKKQIKEQWIKKFTHLSNWKTVFYILLFLLFAFGTSRGIIHYDTGLYHAQSIRWIEEYGVIKGLGNLHCRLAYNSAAFSLSALFSFSFLGGQSYHCVAGVFAFLLAKKCSEISGAWIRKKMLLSDFARIMGIYYLLIIFDEMISPASDYFTVLVLFYLIISWLELIEKKEKSWIPYGLLCLLGVYAMSLKLSAALILLLVIKPAIMLIKEKNVKGILVCFLLGTLIILPYLIRNVIISGWLVYPFTIFDFFPVNWKIPEGIAAYDAKEIQVWGRGVYDAARYGEPFYVWMPSWFKAQGGIDKLFIITGVISLPIWFFSSVLCLIKKKAETYDWVLLAGTVNLSFLFWLFSAPLIRYGCVYVWLAPVITFGGLLIYKIKNRKFWKIISLVLIVIAFYKFFMFGMEIAQAYTSQYFICQKDYENFEVEGYTIEGLDFYYPAEGDRVGYEAFPSSPAPADIMLRGTGMKDGFISRQMFNKQN